MSTLSERILAKKLAEANRPLLPVVTNTEVPRVPIPDLLPKEIKIKKAPKPPGPKAIRKCCPTPRGGNNPHTNDCLTVHPPARTAPPKKQEPNWRWPIGTIITKTWDGDEWHCMIKAPGVPETFTLSHHGSFLVETLTTRIYWDHLKSILPAAEPLNVKGPMGVSQSQAETIL